MKITANYSTHNNSIELEVDDKYKSLITCDIPFEEWKELWQEFNNEVRGYLPHNACMIETRRTEDYAPLNTYFRRHLDKTKQICYNKSTKRKGVKK